MAVPFYAVAFLAGFIEICPPNWPFRFRWPIPPPPPPWPWTWRLSVDVLGGIAGVAGGVLTQRFVGGDNSVLLLTTVAVAIIGGGVVRQVAGYFSAPASQPAAEGLKTANLA